MEIFTVFLVKQLPEAACLSSLNFLPLGMPPPMCQI